MVINFTLKPIQEIVIKLIDYYYKKYLGTPVDAINHTLVRIEALMLWLLCLKLSRQNFCC